MIKILATVFKSETYYLSLSLKMLFIFIDIFNVEPKIADDTLKYWECWTQMYFIYEDEVVCKISHWSLWHDTMDHGMNVMYVNSM